MNIMGRKWNQINISFYNEAVVVTESLHIAHLLSPAPQALM